MKKLVILAILGTLTTAPLLCMDRDQMSVFDMASVSERGSESEDDFVISTVGYEPLPPMKRGLPDIATLSLQQRPEPFEMYDDFAEQSSLTLKRWINEHRSEEQTPDYKSRLAEEKSKTQSPEYQVQFKKIMHQKQYEERLWELEQEYARRSTFDFDPPVMVYTSKPESTETAQRPASSNTFSPNPDYIRHMFNVHFNHVRPNRWQTKPAQQKETRFPRTTFEAQFVAGNIYKTREERAAEFERDAKKWNEIIITSKGPETFLNYRLRILRNMR